MVAILPSLAIQIDTGLLLNTYVEDKDVVRYLYLHHELLVFHISVNDLFNLSNR